AAPRIVHLPRPIGCRRGACPGAPRAPRRGLSVLVLDPRRSARGAGDDPPRPPARRRRGGAAPVRPGVPLPAVARRGGAARTSSQYPGRVPRRTRGGRPERDLSTHGRGPGPPRPALGGLRRVAL